MQPETKSRQAIIDRLMGQEIDAPELPTVDSNQVLTFADPIEAFREMLEFVGGQMHVVDSPNQVEEILRGIDVYNEATTVASLVPECVAGNFDAAAVEDPHNLSMLDWVIARGEFMVAENGCIWVDGNTMPHRVLLFIAQYQAIVVSKDQIVHNMHEAYARIGKPGPGFGVFISGPSKTADIEQSLVLGAHGCRKLQVFLV